MLLAAGYGWSDLKHRPVMNLHEERGFTTSTTFVAPCASVVGNVRIIDHSCVWYGAVIRGGILTYTIDSLHFMRQRKAEWTYVHYVVRRDACLNDV